MEFKLKTPSWKIYITSTLLMIILFGVKFAHIEVPVLQPIFENDKGQIPLIAWLLLFIGVTYKL
jgi:hypothetical protein